MTKILVVDDAAFMRMKAVKVLKEQGYEVVEAGTGAEAVDQYKKEKPDAVLMDITMPDVDGLTALKQLKEIDPGAKVTMVTAMGQQAIVMDALKSGALDFIVKPFDPARIMSAVEKMVA
jgi:two-component system, chemotaxis family, chemotaxis protein CheY